MSATDRWPPARRLTVAVVAAVTAVLVIFGGWTAFRRSLIPQSMSGTVVSNIWYPDSGLQFRVLRVSSGGAGGGTALDDHVVDAEIGTQLGEGAVVSKRPGERSLHTSSGDVALRPSAETLRLVLLALALAAGGTVLLRVPPRRPPIEAHNAGVMRDDAQR